MATDTDIADDIQNRADRFPTAERFIRDHHAVRNSDKLEPHDDMHAGLPADRIDVDNWGRDAAQPLDLGHPQDRVADTDKFSHSAEHTAERTGGKPYHRH